MSSLIISRPFRLEPQLERRPIQLYALFKMNRARIKLVHLIDIYEMKIPKKLSAEEQCFLKWRWNNLTCKSNLNLKYLRMLLHKEHLFWSIGSGIKVWPFPILWPNLPPETLICTNLHVHYLRVLLQKLITVFSKNAKKVSIVLNYLFLKETWFLISTNINFLIMFCAKIG